MTDVRVNVGCGPHRAPAPWINVDLVDEGDVHPDVVAREPLRPLAAWDAETVDAVYLGHVLEHVAWDMVPVFLEHVVWRLRPGGRLCVVGPDVWRTIRGAARGEWPWSLVDEVVEAPQDRPGMVGPGGRHQWNCSEARVAAALEAAGLAARPAAVDPQELAGWPVVSFAVWQCAVVAHKPGSVDAE